MAPTELAPLIALIGSDGSGKSTLGKALVRGICRRRPARLVYLGLGSGDLGRRIGTWPLVGRPLERFFTGKAKTTRTTGDKIPGFGTALVVFAFSVIRKRRFAQMMALRRRGVVVVTDRYPQIEVSGFYDGPGLSAARPGGPVVAWLAARERRIYAEMAAVIPDLVIRLGIDAETAFARKPDHSLSQLRAKVAATSRLSFGGARIIDVDARAPYAQVLYAVETAAAQVVGPQS